MFFSFLSPLLGRLFANNLTTLGEQPENCSGGTQCSSASGRWVLLGRQLNSPRAALGFFSGHHQERGLLFSEVLRLL